MPNNVTTRSPNQNATPILLGSNRFSREVIRRSGENLNMCWHCRTCSSGCPFYHAMDGGPHSIIRLVQLGMWKEALESKTIWLCVGCNTCATQCPNAIDVAAIADTLRIMAIERGVVVPEPGVLAFHEAVLNTIQRYGRTHKLEVMLRYKLKILDFFTDTGIGLKMFAKGKLDLLPSKISRIEEIQKLFDTMNAAERT